MPAPKNPNTAAATAAVRRRGQETMAAKLRAAGWTVTPPEHHNADRRKSMKSVLAGLTIVSAFCLGLVGVSSPAFAAMQGPAGYLTFWDGCGSAGVGYCGATWALNTGGGIGVCHALPTGANDKPSAFSNNTTHNFRVWTAAGCTGSSAILYGGTETGQLGSGFNNTITAQERIS